MTHNYKCYSYEMTSPTFSRVGVLTLSTICLFMYFCPELLFVFSKGRGPPESQQQQVSNTSVPPRSL